MLQKAKAHASSLAQNATDYARVAGDGASSAATNFHGFVAEQAGDKISALREAGYGLTEAAGAIYDEKKKESMHKLFDMAAGPQKQLLFALREVVKEGAVADPHMCTSVKNHIKDAVDLFWVDLELYLELARDDLRDQKTGKLDSKIQQLEDAGSDMKGCTCGCYWWRAKVLYSLMPFDISIFGQFKDPLFWIFTVLSCVTVFGIRIIFFAIVLAFIIMGRPADEYQLTQYILTFKGLQFVSSGLALSIVAAVKYYMCIHNDGSHTCNVDGPGATQGFVHGITDWLGSCLLVWLAFAFLPCSDRTAGLREIATEEAEKLEAEDSQVQSGCCGQKKWDRSRGGRLRGLLTYDLVCFFTSFLFYAFLVYCNMVEARKNGIGAAPDLAPTHLESEADSPEGHTALYWARIVYAFTAFPFIIFKIPGVFDILTHTTPTGYNRNGMCVPYVLRQEL